MSIIPRTARPSGSPAASLGEEYLVRFQWTRWSYKRMMVIGYVLICNAYYRRVAQ